MLEATIDAIFLLTQTYEYLLQLNAPKAVRMIVLSAVNHLDTDIRRQLTGPDRS